MNRLLLFAAAILCVSSYNTYDKVLLSEVKALSLQSNKLTTGRRNDPIQQLNCEKGFCSYGPNNIMCKNVGRSDKDFIWECTGYNLTPGYKLGYSDVGCEGYGYPSDPYILVGSCAVFYSVEKDPMYIEPTKQRYEPMTSTTETTTETIIETINENMFVPHAQHLHSDYLAITMAYGLIFFFIIFCVLFFR